MVHSSLGMVQSGVSTPVGNTAVGDERRWLGKERNSSFTVTELLNKHGAVSCRFRSLSSLTESLLGGLGFL